jgi:hypothetical protein
VKKLFILFMLLTQLVFAAPRIEAKIGEYEGNSYIVIRATGVKTFVLTSPINPDYVIHFPDKPNMWFIRIPNGVTTIPELEFLMDGKPIVTQPIIIPNEFRRNVK